MARRDTRRPSRTTIIVLVLISITLLTLDFRGGGALDTARDGTRDLLAPVRGVVDSVTSPFRNTWDGAFRIDDLEAENADLRARIEELEVEALLFEDQRRQAQEVLDLSGVTESIDFETLAVRVIDDPVSDFERTVELDRGSDDGITVGMPVVAPGGLVGRVIQVSGDRSLAQLLTDGSFGVAVRLSRSGASGVAVGQGRTSPLQIDLLDDEVIVIPGETVLTSGLDGSSFPPGLVVGTVLDARIDAIDGQLDVELAPTSDLNRLDTVAVVLWSPPADLLPSDGPGPNGPAR